MELKTRHIRLKFVDAMHRSLAQAWWLFCTALALSMALALPGCGGGGTSASGPLSPPTITTPPTSVNVAAGSAASFTVVAAGDGLAYQWQRSTNGGLSWDDIAGASAASYSISAVDASMNANQFHVVVQNPAGIVVSSAATLTVSGGAASTNQAVSAGGFHSLLLKSDGSVFSWGDNTYGQLGDGGTVAATPTPVRVALVGGAMLANVTTVSAGMSHSLALRSDGSVLAWGRNNLNQLGDGTTTSRGQAVAVRDAAGNPFGAVTHLSAGNDVSAAVKTDGTVWVWGWHSWLFVLPARNPVPLLDASGSPVVGATKVAVGNGFVLVLKADGSLWTWGAAGAGSDSSTVRATPLLGALGVPVTGISRIAAGWTHALALTTNGSVLSWGTGEIGRAGGLSLLLVPGLVTDATATTLTGVTDVQAGTGLSVIRKADASLWSFGTNSNALLGAGSANSFETYPVAVREPGGVPFGGVNGLSLSNQHVLALRQNGAVWGWGRNANEELAKPVSSPLDYFVLQPSLVVP